MIIKRVGCLKLASLFIVLVAALNLPARANTYRIEPAETTASFEVHFLGVFPIHGDFRRSTGVLVYDAATRLGSIDVSIDATTLESSIAKVQSTTRGTEFFNVEKFASIDFKSSRFVFEDAKLRTIEGLLTLVGVTRPVVLVVSKAVCEPAGDREPAHCHAEATLTVKRSEFGMKAWSRSVSDEVVIQIGIVARKALPESAAAGTPLPRIETAKNP